MATLFHHVGCKTGHPGQREDDLPCALRQPEVARHGGEGDVDVGDDLEAPVYRKREVVDQGDGRLRAVRESREQAFRARVDIAIDDVAESRRWLCEFVDRGPDTDGLGTGEQPFGGPRGLAVLRPGHRSQPRADGVGK